MFLVIFYPSTHLFVQYINTILYSLPLPFTETLFALSPAAHRHVSPASVSLNVTSHLWLRPVLFIARQLKCEGSQWEDKYKSQRAGGVSQTKAGSSPSLSILSALLLTSKVKKRKKRTESLIDNFKILYCCWLFVCMCWIFCSAWGAWIFTHKRDVMFHLFFVLEHICGCCDS